MFDVASVSCPRCARPMCGRCSVALNSNSVHICSAIRCSRATYEFCSSCYTGRYIFGIPTNETTPLRQRTPYVIGTWDAWSKPLEMVLCPGGVYECAVRLGDVCREQFRILLGGSEDAALYPATPCAGPHTPLVGPDGNGHGRSWLLDGTVYDVSLTIDAVAKPCFTSTRREGVGLAKGAPPGMIFKIKAKLQRRVWWEIERDFATQAASFKKVKHTYSLVGTAVDADFQDMRQN